MAGVPGFEPGNAGTKNRCLTAWLYPKKTRFIITFAPYSDSCDWTQYLKTKDLTFLSQSLYPLYHNATLHIRSKNNMRLPF